MIRNFRRFVRVLALVTLALAAQPNRLPAADSSERQAELLKVLASDASPGEKGVACKKLAIYGSPDSVPALAALLPNQELSSWARVALEAIPGEAADKALREALGKLEGRLLIGVINSVAVRKDCQAVPELIGKMKAGDPDVASAAAAALGRLGGDNAAQALTQALASAPAAVKPAVAEGCLVLASALLDKEQHAEAMKMYDAVRQADVPRHKVLEATRGAILSRQAAGLPLLMEQLRSPDKGLLAIGLRTARELPGREVTEALAAEVEKAKPDRQAYLMMALADRTDAGVLPAVLKGAKGGPTPVRLAAVNALDRLGNLSCVPVLLRAASQGDAELAQAAKSVLARLSGADVDADFVARLPKAQGKQRQVLIDLASQRQLEAALPAILTAIKDEDAAIRGAALRALGNLGSEKQAAEVVGMLKQSKNAKDRNELQRALLALCGRGGVKCVPHLLPLAQDADAALRAIALHALSSVGGAEALATVKSAIEDKDAEVQDEAVRTLSTWPDNWPEDAGAAETLLSLAQSGKKDTHRVLGLRGYLQYLQGDKKLQDSEKVGRIKDLLPLIQRTEEKQLAVSVAGSIPVGGSVELLTGFANEPAVANEACSALLNLAAKSKPGISAEQRRQALQTVVDKATQDALKGKARKALDTLK